MLQCKGCLHARYCSRACLLAHWADHTVRYETMKAAKAECMNAKADEHRSMLNDFLQVRLLLSAVPVNITLCMHQQRGTRGTTVACAPAL